MLKNVTCKKSNCLIHTISMVIICLLLLAVIYIRRNKLKGIDVNNIFQKMDTKFNLNLIDIDVKKCPYYFFDDMIDIEDLDPNKIKIDEKSNKNFLIYYIGYETFKDLKYLKNKSRFPLHLIIKNINGYFEEINGNKYLTLVPTSESKDKLKKYEELWKKIRDIIILMTNNSENYNQNK